MEVVMTTPRLNKNIPEAIFYVVKDENDRAIVGRTVVNYSKKHEGLMEKISYVAYRVFETVKSCFGRSDWQISDNILQKGFNALPEDEKELLKGRVDQTTYLNDLVKGNQINWDAIDLLLEKSMHPQQFSVIGRSNYIN